MRYTSAIDKNRSWNYWLKALQELDQVEAVVSTVEDLVPKLLGHSIVGVDGSPGSGKTFLSGQLSKILGFRLIHLDDFVIPHQGSFADNIDLKELRESMERPPYLIEGACLLEILHKIGISPEIIVYVRHPGELCSIASRPVSRRRRHREFDLYLEKWRPEGAADLIYERRVVNMTNRYDIDIVLIKSKTRLSMLLAFGGILTTLAGFFIMYLGIQDKSSSSLQIGPVNVSATGFGGVILASSAVWGFFSYQTRPKYSQTRQTKERFTKDGELIEREEYDSSTIEITSKAD